MTVRPFVESDVEACLEIVRSLPDFFTEDVPDTIRADFDRHSGWVVAQGREVTGFAVVDMRSAGAAEILWAAVRRELRGSGIGTVLIDHVLDTLTSEGVDVVEVKTLDRSADYPPYVATRAFWEGRGFRQIDTIDPLPGWQPGNPAAIYVAALRTTRPGAASTLA